MVRREIEVYAASCKAPKSEKDLDRILSAFEKAETGSLVCFPEYFLDGQPQYAGVEITDELFVSLLDFARDRDLYLALGMVEREGDQKFISGIFISREGEIIGKQRKIDLAKFERKAGISAGKTPRKIIRTDFGTVTFSMCLDQWHFGLTQAEIIIHPRGFGLDDPRYGRFLKKWLLLDRATAMLNRAYLIGATGAKGEGALADIISFEGEVLAIKRRGGVVRATLDLDLLRKYRRGEHISEIVPRF